MELTANHNTMPTEAIEQNTLMIDAPSMLTGKFWRSLFDSAKHNKVMLVSSLIGTALFVHLYYADLGMKASPFFGL
jgi:hypothetical protein